MDTEQPQDNGSQQLWSSAQTLPSSGSISIPSTKSLPAYKPIEYRIMQPSWIVQPTRNNYGLCLSSIHAAKDHNWLLRANIGFVLTVCSEQKDLQLPPSIQRYCIDIDDNPKERIYQFFKTTYHLINNQLGNSNVLVHCMAGVSRSATIVIAFLMKKYKYSYKQARAIVESKRPCVCPNIGFAKQLQLYGKELANDRCTLF